MRTLITKITHYVEGLDLAIIQLDSAGMELLKRAYAIQRLLTDAGLFDPRYGMTIESAILSTKLVRFDLLSAYENETLFSHVIGNTQYDQVMRMDIGDFWIGCANFPPPPASSSAAVHIGRSSFFVKLRTADGNLLKGLWLTNSTLKELDTGSLDNGVHDQGYYDTTTELSCLD